MNPTDFNKMTEEVIIKCKALLISKNVEYARNDDKLHNFKAAGALEQSIPERALRGMLTKHIISIYDYINDIDVDVHHTLDKWDEKIVDSINYLILLRGLLVERYTEHGNLGEIRPD